MREKKGGRRKIITGASPCHGGRQALAHGVEDDIMLCHHRIKLPTTTKRRGIHHPRCLFTRQPLFVEL